MHRLAQPWPLAFSHGLAIPTLLAALLTGLGLARVQGLVDGAADFTPEGPLFHWHLGLALLWLALILSFLPRRRIATSLTWPSLKGLLQLTLLGLMLTGLAQLMAPAPTSRVWHGLFAALALALALGHGLERGLSLGWGRVLSRLLRRQRLRAWLVPSLVLVSLGALLAWLAPLAPETFAPKLHLAAIAPAQTPAIDGAGEDTAWLRAVPRTVTTLDGTRAVPVELRALSNGRTAYFRFRWPDTTRSGVHLPLIKRADGWHVLHAGFEKDDEARWYEDKFAVMLTATPGVGGMASLVLGNRPLPGLPANRHGRGFHRAPEGTLIDLWHWKSVRNLGSGNLDDSHVGAPAAPQLGERRYAAGYRADPRDAGGSRENWAWFGDGPVRPLRLPRDPAALAPFQRLPEPEAPGDAGAWGLHWAATQPYEPELDDYPVGTLMPSVLWQGHNEGDRGDVQAAGQWRDGWWTLELARGLKTHSPFDLPLTDGVLLWVAAFDHTQVRHSYHLRPLRLAFPEARP